jgi:hypothetical protein
LPSRPRAESDDDADLWGPDEPAADAEPDARVPAGPTTADGHRRFRIRTVSAFCDEVDRLARCLQEGDLATAATREADAAVRLRLAARQLEYAQRELGTLLQRQGWSDDQARSSA